MKAGNTFIPAKFDHHLWIILSDPEADGENVVIVNFTTYTVDEEQNCIVLKGEHPFVKHKTAVRYRDAKRVSVSQLTALINCNQLRPHQTLSAALLKRVRDGASLSDFLPEGCRKILEDQGFI